MRVFVCNMSEDVWQFISSLEDRKLKAFEVNENANMSDWNMFSFAPGEEGIFVTPRPISQEFLSYVMDISRAKRIHVLSPRSHSGETCRDVLSDKSIFSALVKFGKKYSLSLTAYSPSVQLYALAYALVRKGVRVNFSDIPSPQNRWTSDFFGSKIGIRQLRARMADGFICMDMHDAAHAAAQIYENSHGVVIKTNKGHSGFGVLIFRPGELPATREERVQKILQQFSRDLYWRKFPIVVEEYQKEDPRVGGGFPSVECRVNADGAVEYLYYCGMRMTHDGVFRGMEIHNSIVSAAVDHQIKKIGVSLGKQFALYGYRGYFDVDLIASRSGQLYVTESNVRRTGGTYVYHMAVNLFGKNFMNTTYILSRNAYPLPGKKKISFHALHDLLEPILYNKKTKEGLILTSEHMMLQHAMGYVIFGKTKARALAIESKMDRLLRQNS